jgi:hypothetical protein
MPVNIAYRSTDRLLIPGFNITFPCVARGVVVYFPIWAVCRVLRIQPQRQLDRIRKSGRFDDEGAIETIGVLTKTGNRPTECIRKDKLATWFDLINPKRLRNTELRDKLVQLQRAMSDAGDRFLWGDASIIAPADTGPGAFPSVIEGTLTITGACPYCGGNLCVTVSPQGAHFSPVMRVDEADDEADDEEN